MAVHVQPRQPMAEIALAVYSYTNSHYCYRHQHQRESLVFSLPAHVRDLRDEIPGQQAIQIFLLG